MKGTFDAARFRELVAELTLGRPLVTTRATGSTNDDALAAARSGAPHGALFVTDEQHAGRGRRGNSWHATPGAGLLFSLVVRPRIALEYAPALALLAGLAVRAAVAEELEAAGVDAKALVKWPNDVVVAGRKLAGILVESQVRGAELGAVVIGVGLNVGRMELPGELDKVSTSLADLGASAARETVLASILGGLETRLGALAGPEMPLESLVGELGRFDYLLGTKIAIGDLAGVGAGIDERGALVVLDAEGITRRIRSGHVTTCGSE
jgi:BirA family biotin operon repressor/biotin-[acetyl-CoA-carboxylase] ligase